MSLILPKGIVVNTAGISGDIERIDQEPLALEEIAKLWKVYTTTKRRLLDPTAERLENYWWRIWGSRKKDLNGATVARLFADISDGRSFIPLRGPPNRDETGGRPTKFLPQSSGSASSTTIHSRPEVNSYSSPQSLGVSKNSAPMPPPILKKNRGPSSSGPRPTARFIAPHGSEAEDPDGILSTSNSPGAHFVVRPPTPESQSSRPYRENDMSTMVSREDVQTLNLTDSEYLDRSNILRRPIIDPITNAPRANKDIYFDVESCTDEVAKGQRTGKPWLKEATVKIERRETRGSKHSATTQNFIAADGVLGSKLMSDTKMVGNSRDVREVEEESLAEGSISLPPTNPTVAENSSLQGQSLSANRKNNDSVAIAGSRGANRMTFQQGSLFAKRPVQPANSASALFAISSPETKGPLSRSKSQLTLLLEKDRAITNEPKIGAEPSTSKLKEAGQID